MFFVCLLALGQLGFSFVAISIFGVWSTGRDCKLHPFNHFLCFLTVFLEKLAQLSTHIEVMSFSQFMFLFDGGRLVVSAVALSGGCWMMTPCHVISFGVSWFVPL